MKFINPKRQKRLKSVEDSKYKKAIEYYNKSKDKKLNKNERNFYLTLYLEEKERLENL